MNRRDSCLIDQIKEDVEVARHQIPTLSEGTLTPRLLRRSIAYVEFLLGLVEKLAGLKTLPQGTVLDADLMRISDVELDGEWIPLDGRTVQVKDGNGCLKDWKLPDYKGRGNFVIKSK